MVTSVFHPLKLNQMTTKNTYGFGGKKEAVSSKRLCTLEVGSIYTSTFLQLLNGSRNSIFD